MSFASARQYVEQLKESVFRCGSIDPEDRHDVPARFDESRSTWVIVRGFPELEDLFEADPVVSRPFELTNGGSMRLQVRIREITVKMQHVVEVVSYRLSLVDIPENPNQIESLRFDKPQGQPRGRGWDEELQDNPEHPHAHLHINFRSPGGNECRMPTAPVSPMLLLLAFDHWYCTTCRI